jgi:hypothetical protein
VHPLVITWLLVPLCLLAVPSVRFRNFRHAWVWGAALGLFVGLLAPLGLSGQCLALKAIRFTVVPWGRSSASAATASSRRNLDQLLELRLGQIGGGELQSNRVLDDRVEPDDLVRIDRRPWEEIIPRSSAATPMSTLPEITACWVSPAPLV